MNTKSTSTAPRLPFEQSYDLLRKPPIAAITKARAEQQDRTQITADKALREAWNIVIVIADARELVQVKIGCCRHCNGEGFRFQRTIAEYNHDREAFSKKPGAEPEDFDEKGGIGFDPLRSPIRSAPSAAATAMRALSSWTPATCLPRPRPSTPASSRRSTASKCSKDSALEKLFKHLGLY